MPLSIIFVLLSLPFQLLADNPVKIVTSIHPLQLITDELMIGVGQSELLIQSDQSPHHFQLKPSLLETAGNANLVVWISNDFETGLNRLQNILPAKTEQLELISSFPHSNLISDLHDIDGHIWLSPENVIIIAELISNKIAKLDPLNQSIYQANTVKLKDKILQWKLQTERNINLLKPRYILDHQFLRYFEDSLGLKNIGSLRNSHDHGSSIKQLTKLHQQLKKTPAKCLLVTKLPVSRQAQQISSQYHLQTAVINTLGENSSHKSIIDLFDSIVKTLSQCQ